MKSRIGVATIVVAAFVITARSAGAQGQVVAPSPVPERAELTPGASAPSDGQAIPAAEVTAPTPPPSLDELIAALSSPDVATRVQAIRDLGERGELAAVEPLTNLLRTDPVPEVRGWAVRTLYEIGTPPARGAVVNAARSDPDERVRSMAARLTGVAAAPLPPSAPPTVAVPPPGAGPVYGAGAIETPSPPPPRRRRPPGRSYKVGGWATFGSTYGLAVLVALGLFSTRSGSDVDWGWKLCLPVVGPVVGAMTNWEGTNASFSVFFWLWSAGQATGVVLLALGYAQAARAAREDLEADDDQEDRADLEPRARRDRRRAGVTFAPGGPGGLPGLTLAGWF